MINNGFILLHRKFFNWEWYTDVYVKSVFLHLLLFANYENKMFCGMLIKRGQVLTSSRKLADVLKINRRTVLKALSILENNHTIKTERTKKGTLITIVKYSDYQLNADNGGLSDAPLSAPLNAPLSAPQDAPSCAPQSAPILNNIKNNNKENNTSSSSTRASEKIDFSEKLKNDSQWCEIACMQLHLARGELDQRIDDFAQHLILQGAPPPRSYGDYKSHCINWLRIINAKQNKDNGNNKKSYRPSNDRPDGWIDAIAAVVDNVTETERRLRAGDSKN